MSAVTEVPEIDEDEEAMDDELDDIDLDDEFLFDDPEEPFEFSGQYKTFSARRRIEIAREDKWLKAAMADFDDDYPGDWQDSDSWHSPY